jgi:hypothetical protein
VAVNAGGGCSQEVEALKLEEGDQSDRISARHVYLLFFHESDRRNKRRVMQRRLEWRKCMAESQVKARVWPHWSRTGGSVFGRNVGKGG